MKHSPVHEVRRHDRMEPACAGSRVAGQSAKVDFMPL